MNPLPLDQIISQDSSLGHNLNSLENKVHDQNKRNDEMNHLYHQNVTSARPQISNGSKNGSQIQGVQGGIDS